MYRFTAALRPLLLLLLSMVATVAVAQPRIIGGQVAELGQFPYQVAVHSGGKFICGGAIIAPRWVLTAAHCMANNPHTYTIVSGTLHSNDVRDSQQVEKIIISDQYRRATPGNDLALLHTATEIFYGDLVNQIPFKGPFVGGHQQGVISGWGRTAADAPDNEVLHFQNVTILSNEECQQHVAKFGHFIGNNTICALPGKGHGICEGDLGGPLVVGGVLAGLASWYVGECADGYADVYMRVSFYADWIDEQMRKIRD